ncbi:hypothetical protein R5H30_17180 [Sulfitobacter sp. D35]|uniref:DUF6538 domain-containing protein n=1 Tax=Sulfitobacter sp. D35 TaxID=3083252 RepID=UPI00296EE0AB|nr:DUF6538 domain-containing protein [Sulfitobacter sp. D35]MDW4499730.1 hypothetical protein [Sulfitobacter sp. D35]
MAKKPRQGRAAKPGKVKHLLHRDGRYYARVVVPNELRPQLAGKTEFRTPLGADRTIALRQLPKALAGFQDHLDLARGQLSNLPANKTPAATALSLTHDEIAYIHYRHRLVLDEQLRNDNPRYAQTDIDDGRVAELRSGIGSALDDEELERAIGDVLDFYAARGWTSVKKHTTEWRKLARKLCEAELEAMARSVERDKGDYSGLPEARSWANAAPQDETRSERVSILRLFADYTASKQLLGKCN